jgi:L-alanine-DL-glutamate epimerase-like enolase superfamily enzyme
VATENVVALEHHGVDVPWWEDIVTGVEKPLNQKGFARVPETPGLGVELNLDVIKQHLARGEECFGSTDEWNSRDSNDRLWS